MVINASTTTSFMITPAISTSSTTHHLHESSPTSSHESPISIHEHEHEHEHESSIPIPVTGVTLKMAFDKNYAVADSSEFKSTRFTSPQSLDLVHQLRRNSDCILVGKGTVIRDDCTLTVRRVALFANTLPPARVVIDSNLEILAKISEGNCSSGNEEQENEEHQENETREASSSFALLQDGLDVIVYHTCPLDDMHQQAMDMNGNLTLVQLPIVNSDIINSNSNSNSDSDSKKGMSPMQIIRDLKSRNMHHVMVEGGPATAIPFLKEQIVDRAIIIRAPVTFIEPVASNMNDDMLIEAGLVFLEEKDVGGDRVEYWVREGMQWPTASVTDWPL
jgi:riboflavin biosynthesis pyrimidine reductase